MLTCVAIGIFGWISPCLHSKVTNFKAAGVSGVLEISESCETEYFVVVEHSLSGTGGEDPSGGYAVEKLPVIRILKNATAKVRSRHLCPKF